MKSWQHEGVRPLADWWQDANRLEELAFCAAHPYPLLVYLTTTYQLRPVDDRSKTMDRVVLQATTPPSPPGSGLDQYLAVPVKARVGKRTFQLSVGCAHDRDIRINDVTVSNVHAHFTGDRHGNWYVQDASSTTGTHVNDRDPNATQVLISGDRISFGMVDVTFMLPSQVYRLVRMLL